MRGPDLSIVATEFPFERISDIAEIESWRKEIYRPIYHMHKWWARRLGSVFRAAILGAALPEGADILDYFYRQIDLNGLVVFDPFMGSGTTVGEAYKLGCTTIGRDINPVAYRLVRTALSRLDRKKIIELFGQLRHSTGKELRRLYTGIDSQGDPCDVLYYFWVKVLSCPSCDSPVDLFSTYMFARHAYPKRHPQVQVICPDCGQIFPGTYTARSVNCPVCGLQFDPTVGNARNTRALCRNCGDEFPMAQIARSKGHPPDHRMYAKLVLRKNGNKEYLRTGAEDIGAYQAAERRLEHLSPLLPHVEIRPGHNTQQILNYGYRYWDELFNARQLLALSLLAAGIRDLAAGPERDTLMVLFSGILEFNNMFASYKGEGTGAVRHMFSHHILKPERMPIEANVWGAKKSSGSFSTLFKSRILRALDYKEAPFEVKVSRENGRKTGRKVYGLSPAIGAKISHHYPADGLDKDTVYLSCGSSTYTDLPAACVDLVVTDPPFFDNVHYSELADFFYVWQQLYFDEPCPQESATTRHEDEVQDADVRDFAGKLSRVFQECHRVLRNDGLLVFSYHHSREEGWSAIADAVTSSGFAFVQSQPVKSEMSGAAPKSQARSPIDLDVLLICRKREVDQRSWADSNEALRKAHLISTERLGRFNIHGRTLSRNDIKVVLYSQLLVELCPGRDRSDMLTSFNTLLISSSHLIEDMWQFQSKPSAKRHESAMQQLALFEEQEPYNSGK